LAKLPKKYIKKYGGINKKAWAAYKRSKKGGSRKRRVSTRAKTTRRRSYRKTTKKTTRRKKNMNFNFGGGLGKGIAVGVAAGVVNKFIPVNIAGADLIIAGMVMKDSTVQKIGAITLGRSLASSFTGLATGGSGNGGGY
jgi:hypothetical protein